MTPRVGVALVTHNSEAWLSETLESIALQSVAPHAIRVVDDHSSDGTQRILEAWASELDGRGVDVQIELATTTERDITTRIAQNFTQAARSLARQGVELIALSDHDDVWLPDRLERQIESMEFHPDCLMLASNGNILESSSTLFETFDVPTDLNSWSCSEMADHVIRHSVATGGASMLRRSLLDGPTALPPRGWLHDRWWSLVAASRCGLRVDPESVILYRISEDQRVGLSRGRQQGSTRTRLTAITIRDFHKLRDLTGLRATADGAARDCFARIQVLKTLVGGSPR